MPALRPGDGRPGEDDRQGRLAAREAATRELSALLRQIQATSEVTWDELAEITHVSRSTVANYVGESVRRRDRRTLELLLDGMNASERERDEVLRLHRASLDDGPARRTTAAPITSPETAQPDRAELVRLVSALAGSLPVNGPAASTAAEDHRREVRELVAPKELSGRAVELAELTSFCGGTEPYAWWQGEPWAGKTALTSWFVLYPPPGIDVVSFFVRRSLVGHHDSGAFATAIAGQLAELLDEPAPAPGMLRYATLSRLLESASAQAQVAGRRLLLVVDGLDEDRSADMGLPTIAAYLPRRPPLGLRVLVTGRPNLGLPADDLADHPLRAVPPRLLMPSVNATRIKERAHSELLDLIGGRSAEYTTAREVVGFVAAAGGGLSRADVEELTGEPPFVLDGVLAGLARTVEERGPDRVLLFAHDTLRATALQLLGGSTARWAQRIDDWAGGYAARGWPADTPDYLLRRYVTQLVERRDIARAGAYTGDSARHERLYTRRGGHLLARTEVAAVLRALAGQVAPDLTSMARVAAQWRPPTSFPTDLPAAWLLLGESGHATALLEDMADHEQIAALCSMIDVAAAVEASDRVPTWGERAATLAAQQVHPGDRIGGLKRVAQAIAAAGHRSQATRIVAGIGDVEDRRFVELGMVEGLIPAGDVDEAVRRTFAEPVPRFAGLSLRNVGRSLARVERVSAAERVLAELPDARLRLPVRAAIGTALLRQGRTAEAFAVATAMLDDDTATGVEVSAAAACDLVERLATVDPDQARPLSDRIAAALYAVRDDGRHTTAVQMLLDIGRPDVAETVAAHGRAFIASRYDLLKVGEGYATAGRVDDALRIAHLLSEDRDRYRVQAAAACAAAQAGDAPRARALVAQIERDSEHVVDPSVHAANLEPLARSLNLTGAHDRARDVVRQACVAALRHTTVHPRTTPARLARGFIRHRLPDLAELAAAAVPESNAREHLMAEVAAAMASAGRFADAVRLAAGKPWAATGVLTAALTTGRLAEAEDCLRMMAAGRPPQTALVALATAYLEAGELEPARRLAREAADTATPGYWSEDMVEVVMVLHAVGERIRAASVVAALIADSTPKALRLLARIHARTGKPAAALATARQAREPNSHPTLDNTVAGDIAEALERNGHSDWADAAADTVDGDRDRIRVRHRQIRAALAAGALNRALALAALTVGTVDNDSDAVNDLAATLVIQGRTDTAFRLARDRQNVARTALMRAAVAIAENGDAAQAEAAAAEIPDGWGANARRMVAAATARYGDHATARAVADRIAVDHTRGLAYGDLAVELQTAGLHLEARRTMAEALCAATWPDLIVPLGMIDSDAVHALADIVMAAPSETPRTPPGPA